MNRKIALTILITLLLAGSAWFLLNRTPGNNPGTGIQTKFGQQVTIYGTRTCVPHKKKGGVQTLECLMGVKDAQGHYYSYSLKERFNTPSTNEVVLRGTLTEPQPNSIHDLSGIVTNATLSSN